MNEIRPPSGYRVEQAMAAWASARARLLADDSGLDQDEAALTELLGDAEGDVEDVLARLLRAARDAEAMAESAAGLIEDMQARKTRFARRNEAFRATAFAILDALGRSKIELARPLRLDPRRAAICPDYRRGRGARSLRPHGTQDRQTGHRVRPEKWRRSTGGRSLQFAADVIFTGLRTRRPLKTRSKRSPPTTSRFPGQAVGCGSVPSTKRDTASFTLAGCT